MAEAFEVDASARRLSMREAECLFWAGRGKSSTDIGAILGVSGRTVDSYLAKACAKLGVRTRIEAVAIAVEMGWLVVEGDVRNVDDESGSGGLNRYDLTLRPDWNGIQ